MFLIKNKINIYLYFFFLLFILVFIKFSTAIVLADNYIVKNIKIKEQYDINFNKDNVINRGFEKGFKTLIFKIVESKDKNLFKNIPNNKISSLIDNFSITNEKFVNNNYEVDFEVKFDKKKLLSFIREKNVMPRLTIQQFDLMKIRKKGTNVDEKVYEKLILRSLFGNINASRNSA